MKSSDYCTFGSGIFSGYACWLHGVFPCVTYCIVFMSYFSISQ
ncbi:hypothetical protein X975_24542, partial [Stegodyphus mimosarum]